MMYLTKDRPERAVLTGVALNGADEGDDYLCELASLAQTSGAEVVGRLIQRREAAHAAHYVGKGKLAELNELINDTRADTLICDDELTPAQLRGLLSTLHVKVLDRTSVILDIFAARALTGEGIAQVELAQHKYRLSRLTGLGISLSRQAGGGGIQGGGIGTRGPGETKLETDRRHIRSRIHQLNKELDALCDNRAVLRTRRVKNKIPVVSLVGYTNAGKSTLMNAITGAGVNTEDRLFATLDTTTRKAALPGGAEFLLTDTVGFIHKLPHMLIQAFRATLEELRYADVLLHVVDAANPDCAHQMKVVYETLGTLSCADKPVITVFNKIDLLDGNGLTGGAPFIDRSAVLSVPISAATGEKIPDLLAGIETQLHSGRQFITVCIPYSDSHWVHTLHEKFEICAESHEADGTRLCAYVDEKVAGQMAPYRI
jgi:GTP-binding protein HflX